MTMKAAGDNAFLAALAENPLEALKSYDLTTELRAALAAGDAQAIEKWLGYSLDQGEAWPGKMVTRRHPFSCAGGAPPVFTIFTTFRVRL